MKYLIICLAAGLVACSAPDIEVEVKEAVDLTMPTPRAVINVPLDGKITLAVQSGVSEPRACILPIQIQNGTDSEVNVTMIGFNLTGPGEDSQGNMFAPIAASGTMSEARVILEGQSCDAYDAISVPEIMCVAGAEDCSGDIIFADGPDMTIARAE